jgi:hypothetical protein
MTGQPGRSPLPDTLQGEYLKGKAPANATEGAEKPIRPPALQDVPFERLANPMRGGSVSVIELINRFRC